MAKGDEVCRQARQAFVASQSSPPSTPEQAAALQRELIQASESELHSIEALHAPAEVEPALQRYLRAREQGITLLRKGLEAAQDEDAQAYATAQRQVSAGQVDRLKLAQAVGFNECSRPSSSSDGE